MNFYSQAGQDRRVRFILGKQPGRTFVDIGCGGQLYSNTWGLEEIGWRGWLVDNSEWAQTDSKSRPSTFILADATKMEWPELTPIIDYLSVDVDGATFDALKNFPLDKTRFRLATVEHDSYRFGNEMRDNIRALLLSRGYHLARADVSNPEPFEDWWADKDILIR